MAGLMVEYWDCHLEILKVMRLVHWREVDLVIHLGDNLDYHLVVQKVVNLVQWWGVDLVTSLVNCWDCYLVMCWVDHWAGSLVMV